MHRIATLITLLLVAGVSRAAPTSFIELALALRAEASALAALWPGFWPPGQPFLIYQEEGPCLIASERRPEPPFTPVDGHDGLWTGECNGLVYRRSYLIDHAVGGLRLHGVSLPAHRGQRTEAAITLIHEAFHDYQSRHFQGTRPTPSYAELPLATSLLMAQLDEARRLVAITRLDDPEHRLMTLRELLAARAWRLERMPEAAGLLEDHYMREEGSAHYLGLRAGALLGASNDPLRRLALEQSALARAQGTPWEALLRWQSYATGAAAAFLLDQLGLDWQRRLAAGESFYDLLSAAAGNAPADWNVRFSPPLDDADLREQARALLARASTGDDALASFWRQRPHLTVISEGPLDLSFDTQQLYDTGAGQLAVYPRVLTVDDARLSLDVRGRSSLVDATDGDLRLVVSVPAGLNILGCGGRLDAACPAGTLIQGAGLRMELRQPAQIEADGGSYRVRLEPSETQQGSQD